MLQAGRRAYTAPAEHATASSGCGTRATPSQIRHRVSSARLQNRRHKARAYSSLPAPSVAICPRVGPSKAPVSLFGLRRTPGANNCVSNDALDVAPARATAGKQASLPRTRLSLVRPGPAFRTHVAQ
ncbi:uncharacterized protein LOC144100515 [Amblyomma americanum]